MTAVRILKGWACKYGGRMTTQNKPYLCFHGGNGVDEMSACEAVNG